MPSLQPGRGFYLCDGIKMFVIKKKLTNYFFYTTASRSCCNKAVSYGKLCQRPLGRNVYMFIGCGHSQFPSNALRSKQTITKGTQILHILQVHTEGIAPLHMLGLPTED